MKKTNLNSKPYRWFSKTSFGLWKSLYLIILMGCLPACESFLEIDPPKDKLISETVFEDPTIIESTLANIYYKLREQSMVSGIGGLSILMGIYTDELDYIGSNRNDNSLRVYDHTVTASHPTVSSWWSNAYNLLYVANDIIEGVENSSALSMEEKDMFKGQALFVRAYIHSLLVSVFGDIPYIDTVDYKENNTVARTPIHMVYDNIIADLNLAIPLLNVVSGERIFPNTSAANALLARMYLYTENWSLAEETATKLIDTHTLEPDVNKVFLRGSQETFWQFKPGPDIRNTQEGQELIYRSNTASEGYSLTDNLLLAFEFGDLRRSNWVGNFTSSAGTVYFAHKYKEPLINSRQPILEYSIVFRLAEQYLIRAEARTYLNKIVEAQEDLNAIRNRAGLANTTAANRNTLLDAIIQERRIELFAEHGQRFFDLKRMGKTAEVLTPIKPNWQDTHILLPIPDTELLANPNLKPQNDGY